jgi:hypothetical protein
MGFPGLARNDTSVCLDPDYLTLLSPSGETTPLDRYFKGSRHFVRRLLSFFYHLFRTWHASAA